MPTVFERRRLATTAEMAAHLGLSVRTVTVLSRHWITDGFLEISDPSRKNRSYRLGPPYERLVGL